MNKKVTKAIIPVAGLGTRFLPATKAMPKEMLPIVDRPVIQIIVEDVIKAGIKDIIFVTGKGKHALEDHFDAHRELEFILEKKGKKKALKQIRDIFRSANFTYVRQPYPNGDGDALLSAAHLIGQDEAFLMLYGDDIIKHEDPRKSVISEMVELYEQYQAPILAVQKVAKKDVSKYGIIDPKKVGNKIYEVESIIEKPESDKAPSRLAMVGKYILTADIFSHLREGDITKGEVRVSTHGLDPLLRDRAVYAYEFSGKRFDTGSKLGYLKATVEFALADPELKKEFKKFLKKVV